MFDLITTSSFSTLLQQQQYISWQKFVDQYQERFTELKLDKLNVEQLAHFQQAITLSDFILQSALQAPELVIDVFSEDLISARSAKTPIYQSLLKQWLVSCQDEGQLHRQLRRFRLKEMVNIARADLLLGISLDESLARLSALADALIVEALAWLTHFCQQKWGTPCNNEGKEQPLLVYGMGKLGGRELNFSSDIDLIFVYPNIGETQGARRSLENQQFFTRLGQKLITALNQQTADGFVYRVDMRLRPFGESGPLVMTFSAMEDYYQEQGRDWERYAMLKARLIGNNEYHQKLSKMLRPFVYRRYIDFSVIDSLRRMKMMISQEVRRKNLVNNIKLGAGGIREIEFIVQVFQLIRGGRETQLQQRNLLTVLPILVELGEVGQSSANTLVNAYRFLRRVENIIQALADQQTQTLPDTPLDQARIIQVLNINSWREFLVILEQHMNAVHQEFIQLIGEESPNHQAEDQHWVTLWHSQWSDEESIAWIEQAYLTWSAEDIWRQLADFRHDSNQRSIGQRGRQVLDKLIPLLLWHLQPEEKMPANSYQDQVVKGQANTLSRVLLVIGKIITRTAYLELLFENEGALKHLIKLCHASSWVTEHIAKYPILLDELIDPKLLHNPPALSTYRVELREIMLRIPEEDLEAQMDCLRQFKQAQQLRIAAGDISSVLPVTKVSDHLTALAEAIVDEVINLAWQQISLRFGVPESTLISNDKGFAVIGYGKMGGLELGYSSDLDLVFLHNSEQNELTNGAKQVHARQFYMKLAQRIMHICNTRMSSGILYELDMRLRPSGNSGLLAIHINTFEQYQLEDAWTWEHQALVRGRMIYGELALQQQFTKIRQGILSLSRDQSVLRKDVVEMRNKMRGHLDKSKEGQHDIKQGVGGLVDIEFLAQYLVLKYTEKYAEICTPSDNISIFEQLYRCKVLTFEQKQSLTQGYCSLRDRGHQLTLQNEQLLISSEEFSRLSRGIVDIWLEFMTE